ncbi:hypothetical protein [Sporomusa sp. KB1]|jgi:hypothetical protein|uniref:phage neck terminator protein n=1 Tax=Sporomusa sp. KB1 TaxID=943346 RepID=UPI00119DFA23|nr:hypothetical protein [Sporomusa sp. KB1]TWH46335.1 hypothetical protein Salpa_2316 [Sporomusa sp. KB1]
MADLILTTEQLEDLFWKVTMLMLGFNPDEYNDPDNPPTFMPVRISWPTEGAPAWKIHEDVAFLRIDEEDDEINILRDNVLQAGDEDSANQTTGQTRVIRVHWLLYGPNSWNNASKIRRLLYDEPYREPLTANQVFLIPRVKTPQRLPELFGGRWWERADVAASFNTLVRYDSTVPYIKSAEVTIQSNPESGITNTTTVFPVVIVDKNTKTHGGV